MPEFSSDRERRLWAWSLAVAVTIFLMNLVIDLLYTLLDPRIKHD